MTTTPLPRKSKAATDRALRTLALAKLLKDQIRTAENHAKAYLMKVMDPMDTKKPVDDDGVDVATITMSKPRIKPGTGAFTITDPIALAAWADTRDIAHGGKSTVVFPEWFTAPKQLEALARQAGGEVPDGLEWVPEEYGDPSITVRQTPAQADALIRAVTPVQALIESITPEED